MTTREFLLELRGQDIRVWADGDRLRVNGPQGALTPELQASLRARKPEILAFVRAATGARSSVVPIQPRGSRPAFFGVPGHNGDVFCYVRLAQHLGDDQPFFAFEPPGVDGAQPPLTSIVELAAVYARDLRAFQPEGPYRIGGYCMGGLVAFELARQLQQQGQEVALLVLFDSIAPSTLGWRKRTIVSVQVRRDQVLRHLRTLRGQSWRARLAFAAACLARLAGRAPEPSAPPDAEAAMEERRTLKDHVGDATIEGAYAYARERRTFAGDIVHFLASEESGRRGAYGRQLDWQHFARRVEVEVGPAGCDSALMLREPYAATFAERLRQRLDAVAGSRMESARAVAPGALEPPVGAASAASPRRAREAS